MVDESDVTEEAGSTALPNADQIQTKDSHDDFMKSGKRNLSEKELQSPIAVRFLIADLDRRGREIDELKPFRERYQEAVCELGVLKEARKPAHRNEILSSLCLAIGSAGLGVAPSLMDDLTEGIPVFVLSAVLVLGSVAFRMPK